MAEVESHSDELHKEDSIRFSKFLSGGGLSSLQVAVNRQAVSYETDITNAFSLFEDTYTILSGSISDGAGLYYGYGTMSESSDLDYGMVYRPLNVTESDGRAGSEHACLVKMPDKDYTGYVKLRINKEEVLKHDLDILQECKLGPDGELYLSSKLMMSRFQRVISRAGGGRDTAMEVHGPALNIDLPPEVVANLLETDDANVIRTEEPSFRSKSETGVDQTDMVLCLESKTWPSEAGSFKTRQRAAGWPKQETIEQISQSGCLFAAVGHKEAVLNDLQWRMSFNKAEALLTKSFNETQMQCYVLLKVFCNEILKPVSNKNITSYIVKTTMFWVSESLQEVDWRQERLISCFRVCIAQLRQWLKDLYMPNYFIADRNMFLMSEFPDAAVGNTIKALDDVTNNTTEVLGNLALLQDNQRARL